MRHVAIMVVTYLPDFKSKSWREQRQHMLIHQSKKNSWTWALRTRSGNTLRNIAPPAATTRPGACKLGGRERGEVDPAMQQSIQEPTKEGKRKRKRKRKRKVHPAMNSSSRDTPGGRERERERGEEEEKTRRQTTLPAMPLASRDAPRRKDGGAAKVHELVVVEIHNLHYTQV